LECGDLSPLWLDPSPPSVLIQCHSL